MNWKLRLTLLGLAAATVLTPLAGAQCGAPLGKLPASTHGMLKPSAFVLPSGQLEGQLQDSFGRDREEALEPIVGLWKVSFVSMGTPGIPDGTLVDHGYSVWHSDKTEILNSSRKPLTGSFCLGVWEKVDRRTYRLNHFALAFDDTGATPVGTVNIREEVTVGPEGRLYKGSFTFDFYDTNGVHYPSNVPGNHISGTVTGERMLVSSPVS